MNNNTQMKTVDQTYDAICAIHDAWENGIVLSNVPLLRRSFTDVTLETFERAVQVCFERWANNDKLWSQFFVDLKEALEIQRLEECKYRFYFSAQQYRVIQAYRGSETFVTLPSGVEVPYTEWCSSPTAFCRWEDARLVYATDEEPKIRCVGAEKSNDEDFTDWEGTDSWDEPYNAEFNDEQAYQQFSKELDSLVARDEAEMGYDVPFPDIDDLTPDMDEDIPEEHLEELRQIEESYLRKKYFHQDT